MMKLTLAFKRVYVVKNFAQWAARLYYLTTKAGDLISASVLPKRVRSSRPWGKVPEITLKENTFLLEARLTSPLRSARSLSCLYV